MMVAVAPIGSACPRVMALALGFGSRSLIAFWCGTRAACCADHCVNPVRGFATPCVIESVSHLCCRRRRMPLLSCRSYNLLMRATTHTCAISVRVSRDSVY
uniref:Putative secreted protein n=1 Tax=Anopheles darlingi TaxID=43151 RepID=A0A2M4DN32_ANODA